MLQLMRIGETPVLTPREDIPWEKDAVLNCAAIYDNNKFHLLYRAVAHNPGDPNRSSIGYAWSENGVDFQRLEEPVLRPGTCSEESQGVEDPRVVKFGEEFYMLYTAYDGSATQIALAISKDMIHWRREGVILSNLEFGNNKDASLFPAKIGGRWCMMHRPEPHIYLAYSDDMHAWSDHVCIMKQEFNWESAKIGGGAQPIKTDKGWLMVYHGVDKDMRYRLGIALLDLRDPSKVIKRQPEWILQAEKGWEVEGDVNNVVFTCGAVLIGEELWVYYGGADTVIGLAKGNVREFLEV